MEGGGSRYHGPRKIQSKRIGAILCGLLGPISRCGVINSQVAGLEEFLAAGLGMACSFFGDDRSRKTSE